MQQFKIACPLVRFATCFIPLSTADITQTLFQPFERPLYVPDLFVQPPLVLAHRMFVMTAGRVIFVAVVVARRCVQSIELLPQQPEFAPQAIL